MVAEPEVGAIRASSVHGRRLPGVGWTEEAEHLAVANVERNIIKSNAIAEALGQMLDDQGLVRPPAGKL